MSRPNNNHSRERDARFPMTVTYLITGAVQGVGFRPFVFRLARGLGLSGWVRNDAQGVTIRATGFLQTLDAFKRALKEQAPAAARIDSIVEVNREAASVESGEFRIVESEAGGLKTAQILPDLATCPDCLRELFDPADRRYLYPFTNCTHCGPRFSILEHLPYDRPNTTMKSFTMCESCRREYENSSDRRFHAQPNACPDCGPHLEWWDKSGKKISERNDALSAAAEAVRHGQVVAVKGLGGFHLLVDARNPAAVGRLRERKNREEKPLAIMCPSLGDARRLCAVSADEQKVLTSPEAPIVLLRKNPGANGIADAVAPNNPYLGVMLPYTPLHHLLLRELAFPVIATSGNLSDEPICIDEHDAVARLGSIADAFLVHNRPIARPIDDSVVRVVNGSVFVLRRARGYAPRPVPFVQTSSAILAVGAHLKNTVALAVGGQAVLSQHIGDLETFPASQAFEKAIDMLESLYDATPDRIACDLHPDYFSTRHAAERKIPLVTVQHHHAHVAACMAENGLDGEVLGVSWDGTGYGPDGTVWGGEFLLATRKSYTRAGHLRRFRLPGGDAAVKEPRRSAMGALFELFGDEVFSRHGTASSRAFTDIERPILAKMLKDSIHSPLTSSAGRLFDAVSSLVGLRQKSTFEGQAAMELEFALPENAAAAKPYDTVLRDSEAGFVADWSSVIGGVLDDLAAGQDIPFISARFHNSMVALIVAAAARAHVKRVVLSGGCFQNAYLLSCAVARLKQDGFEPHWHHEIPTNDGGIALGQTVVAAASILS